MKKWLPVLLFCALPAFGQLEWFPILQSGAPSNPCGVSQISINTANGDLYTCNGTTWVKAGGSGTGTVTSVTFTGDGTVLSSTPSTAVTTSGTVTGALANAASGTLLGNSTASTAAPTYGTFASYGIPRIVYSTSTGSQNATVGATTVATPSGNHHYRLSGLLKQLAIGSAGTCNTTGTATLAWAYTDVDNGAVNGVGGALTSYGGASNTNLSMVNTALANSTRNTMRPVEIYALSGVAITYAITVVQDNCTTHETFSFDPLVEQLD